jgi:hypothetical protein
MGSRKILKSFWIGLLVLGLFAGCGAFSGMKLQHYSTLEDWFATCCEPDHDPPAFTLISPTDGQVNVPWPLIFKVRITDPSGVYVNMPGGDSTADPWSVKLRLENLYLNPILWDEHTNIFTFTDSNTLPIAEAGHCYSATVEAHDMLKNPGSLSLSFRMEDPSNPDPSFGATDEVYPCTYPVFGSKQVCLKDTDGDGIPDDGKTLTRGGEADQDKQRPFGNEANLCTTASTTGFTTDLYKRTLFIRPILLSGGANAPWSDFTTIHLPYVKVPFEHRGIELKVIDDLDFDPYDRSTSPIPDSNNPPPVSIVEIIYDMDTVVDNWTSTHFFDQTTNTWYWGIMGLTPYNTSSCSNKTKYGYFQATIYGKSIDKYINDHQYKLLNKGQYPTSLAAPFSGAYTPMNFDNDETVEFNAFVFDQNGRILDPVPSPGLAEAYTKNQVIERVIAHEIGHTLLNASEGDHCANPDCIMYGSLSSVTGWEMKEFGAGSGKKGCSHLPGNVYDITPRVFNALNPQYLPPNQYPCPQ